MISYIKGGDKMRQGNPEWNYLVDEKHIQDLPLETQYRFAEIEVRFAMEQVKRFYREASDNRQSALHLILMSIHPTATERDQTVWEELTRVHLFAHPLKDELVHYFRFHKVPYAKITQMTGVSPNTISKRRYDYPNYYPVFRYWTEPMLKRWNTLKQAINVFNQDLYHSGSVGL
jgi:hypothetical protein